MYQKPCSNLPNILSSLWATFPVGQCPKLLHSPIVINNTLDIALSDNKFYFSRDSRVLNNWRTNITFPPVYTCLVGWLIVTAHTTSPWFKVFTCFAWRGMLGSIRTSGGKGIGLVCPLDTSKEYVGFPFAKLGKPGECVIRFELSIGEAIWKINSRCY